jgi:hypothetical protein
MVAPNVHTQLHEVQNADRRRECGDTGQMLALMCECGDPRCHATVLMTVEEYDAHGGEPILHPSHA